MKKVAIIGAGNIFETVHYPQFSRSCEVAAVVDAAEGRSKAMAEKYDIPLYFTSDNELYANIRPDIVCVCTPNKFHYGTVMRALEQGCHVLCEKPPAMISRESGEMAAGWGISAMQRQLPCAGEAAMVADGAQGHRLQTLIEMIYKSAESGDPVVCG